MADMEETVAIGADGGDLTVTITEVDRSGGSTDCHLHIPHSEPGHQLAMLIGSIPGVERGLLDQIRTECDKIDANFREIERWATYYIENCCCMGVLTLSFTGGT